MTKVKDDSKSRILLYAEFIVCLSKFRVNYFIIFTLEKVHLLIVIDYKFSKWENDN